MSTTLQLPVRIFVPNEKKLLVMPEFLWVNEEDTSKLAPIAAVMQFYCADYEALQLHLSGKRDRYIFRAESFCFKKILKKYQLILLWIDLSENIVFNGLKPTRKKGLNEKCDL